MRKFVLRLSTLTSIVLALLAGGALFWVSQQVQMLEHEQRQLKQDIATQKEGIRVLDAEWDYLNRPDRLEALVADHLKTMAHVTPENLLQDAKAVPDPALQNEDERTVLISTEDHKATKKQVPKDTSRAVPDSRPITVPNKGADKNFDQMIDDMTGDDQ